MLRRGIADKTCKPIEQRRGREGVAENRGAVGRIEQHRGHQLLAAEDVEAPDVEVLDVGREPLELGGVGREVRRVDRRHNELSDFFVHGHLAQRVFNPLASYFVERGGCRRPLSLEACEAREADRREEHDCTHCAHC